MKLSSQRGLRIGIILSLIAAGLVANTILSSPKVYAAQADLTASLEPAGEMDAPAEFTDLTTETFNSIATGSFANSSTSLSIGTATRISSGTSVTAQSGGTNASPTNTNYTLCTTNSQVFAAGWYGGSGGTGRFASVGPNSCSNVGGVSISLTNVVGVSPSTNIYRYIGFWWSGGNAPNIVRLIKSGNVEAVFTTTNLINQLGAAPNPGVAGDYFGNPSSNFNSSGSSGSGWNEPYAYIHLRLPTGFDTVQFIGSGFEFDNVSIRQNVPSSTSSEVAIVGSGVVGSCANLADTNAQYVLRNGSFEDNYITAANGSTSAAIADMATSDTTTERAKWVRYGGPYQFSTFNDADSGLTNRIPFWITSASDGLIELQRQISGSEADGSSGQRNSTYWDLYAPKPADGLVHAEINAESQAALYQDIRTIGGEKITWTIKHRGRFYGTGAANLLSSQSDSRDKFEIKIGPTGSTTAQTPSRKRLPNSVWNSGNAEYGTNAWTTFSTNTTGHTAQTMYTTLEDGWVLYTGTYTVPANQTTTRFEFSSRGSGTLGNLIDDITFDPIIACPRTVTIQKNVTATYDVSPLIDSQIPNYTYPETTTVSSVSINGGTGTATLDTSDSSISLSSNTVGSFQVLYTLTDINNQTSTSTITVNVEDAAGTTPALIPVDPRATSVSLPSFPLIGSASSMICIRQVQDASGNALVGSADVTVARSSATNGVTFNSATNLWNFFGASTSVQTQSGLISISGTNSNPVVTTASKYIQVGVTAATTYGSSACFTGNNYIIELKPLNLSNNNQFTVELS